MAMGSRLSSTELLHPEDEHMVLPRETRGHVDGLGADIPTYTDDVAGSESEPSLPPPRASKLVLLRGKRDEQRHEILLRQWEGVVIDVTKDEFTARIIDLNDREALDEVVEIPMDEIAKPDLGLVQPGAIFYWHIGYEISRSGERRRRSQIKMRRNPRWTDRALSRARESARTLLRDLAE